jgi:hypothetical protein
MHNLTHKTKHGKKNMSEWHHLVHNNNINNNQAFYSQASWGRLEMKPHEQKKGIKQE